MVILLELILCAQKYKGCLTKGKVYYAPFPFLSFMTSNLTSLPFCNNANRNYVNTLVNGDFN